jgi:hypothetical protein
MRPAQSLKTKLDAYDAQSVDDGAASKERHRKWAVYAAAAGSGLALTTSAEAGIIYSGVQNVSVNTSQGTGVPQKFAVDIDGQGHSFQGQVSAHFFGPTKTGLAATAAGAGLHGLEMILNGSGQLKNLASGAKISNGAGVFGNGGLLRSKASSIALVRSAGTWPKSHTGFAGLKFTEGGQDHFGWIRLEWKGTSKSVNTFPASLTAIDWAYETDPNTSINAGQEFSAVPEPGSAVLALLATGSVGVATWRKRRSQEAAKTRAGSVD